MIRFFRSSFLIQHLALLAMAILLWLPAFLKAMPPAHPLANEPLYKLLVHPLQEHPFISVSMAFVLMMLGGFLLNAMLRLYNLIPRTSVLGLLFWVIVSGSFPAAMFFQPLWPSLLLMLFAVNLAFSMYEMQSKNLKLFNFGMLTALSALMHGGTWVFALWMFAVLLILRLNRFREWQIPLFGLIIPLVYLLIVWFLQNRLFTNLNSFLLATVKAISLPQAPESQQIFLSIFLIVLFFSALTFNYSSRANRNVAVRKRKAMTNAFLITSLMVFFARNGGVANNLLLIIPLSIHLALWGGSLSRTARPSVFLWLYYLLAVAHNFHYFFRHA